MNDILWHGMLAAFLELRPWQIVEGNNFGTEFTSKKCNGCCMRPCIADLSFGTVTKTYAKCMPKGITTCAANMTRHVRVMLCVFDCVFEYTLSKCFIRLPNTKNIFDPSLS